MNCRVVLTLRRWNFFAMKSHKKQKCLQNLPQTFSGQSNLTGFTKMILMRFESSTPAWISNKQSLKAIYTITSWSPPPNIRSHKIKRAFLLISSCIHHCIWLKLFIIRILAIGLYIRKWMKDWKWLTNSTSNSSNYAKHFEVMLTGGRLRK